MQQDSLITIQAYYEGLTKNDKKIADYVLNHGQEVHDLTIEELAKACATSIASVSRFVKKIGYSNYREFLMDLPRISSTYGDVFSEVDETDSVDVITEKTFNGAIHALQSTKKMLSQSNLAKASKMIRDSHHLGFFGLGGSSIVALDGYHKFLRTSLNTEYHPDYDIQLMQAVKMNQQDCAIVISHSGKNQQTMLIAKELHRRHVSLIVITSYPESELAQLADLTLISVAEEVNFRSESMASLIAQLTIMDSLFMITAVGRTKISEEIIADVRQVMDQTRKK